MKDHRPAPSAPEDERALREWLAQVVAGLGDDREIVAVERKRFPHIGSYDCYRVSVALDRGPDLQLFLKDYRFSRQSKDAPEARRRRELRVYRELLAGAGLGTPACYGAQEDERSGRCWLLIELVEGIPVDRVEASTGVLAADWLARMHDHFARRPGRLGSADFLTRHDADFFRAKACGARRDVGRIAPEAVPAFERVVLRYEAAIPWMTADSPTLVHGGFIPWHLILDREREPTRVCVIDWELAALGSPFYDLAYFVDDGESAAVDAICQAYRDRATRLGLPLPDRSGVSRAVRCFRLHRVFDWLSRAEERGFAPGKVAKLVRRAARLADGLA